MSTEDRQLHSADYVRPPFIDHSPRIDDDLYRHYLHPERYCSIFHSGTGVWALREIRIPELSRPVSDLFRFQLKVLDVLRGYQSAVSRVVLVMDGYLPALRVCQYSTLSDG